MTSSPQFLHTKISKHDLDHIQFLTTCVQILTTLHQMKRLADLLKISTSKSMSFGERNIKKNRLIYLFHEFALIIHLKNFYRRGWGMRCHTILLFFITQEDIIRI